MAELDFYLAADEEPWLVSMCINRGLQFVPDILRPSSEYELLKTSEAILSARAETPQFFLVLPSVSTQLVLDTIKSGPRAGLHYVVQSAGCPVLMLFFPTFSDEDGPWLANGSLAVKPRYWDPVAWVEHPTPEVLKAAYKSITREIRSKTTRITNGVRTYYVSPIVNAQRNEGLRLLGFDPE